MASKKRWTRSHSPRLLAGPALALAAALAAAGCTSAAAGTGSAQAHGTAPAVTQAQARQAFDSYVATAAKAARTGDSALELSVVTGAQRALVTATVKAAHGYTSQGSDSSGQGAYSSSLSVSLDFDPYRYGTPTFYLPEAAGFPRFFVADVTRTFSGTNPADGIATWVGGAEVPLDGPVLMLFEQASAGAPWLLATVSQLPAGESAPRLATDSTGHVPTVPLSATTLLAQPYVTGPLQAAVVDDGPASAASNAVADGPLTTGMYQGAREHKAGLSAPSGDVYQWDLEGTPYPAFALRTADGGALVFYAMYLNTTVAVPGYIDDANPVEPGPPIEVPAGLRSFLPAGGHAPRVRLESQQLLSFAAIDPPPGSAKIQVIAVGGGLNYADAS